MTADLERWAAWVTQQGPAHLTNTAFLPTVGQNFILQPSFLRGTKGRMAALQPRGLGVWEETALLILNLYGFSLQIMALRIRPALQKEIFTCKYVCSHFILEHTLSPKVCFQFVLCEMALGGLHGAWANGCSGHQPASGSQDHGGVYPRRIEKF